MSRYARAWDWLRAIVLLLGLAWLTLMAWRMAAGLLGLQPLGIDFMPMWAAAREAFINPRRIYDFVGLTRFEHPLLAHFHGLRPFVYPPPALLLFAPFGLASFAVANAVWTTAGLAVILWSVALRIENHRLLLMLGLALSPASVLVMVTGQVTFAIAAAAVAGVLSLDRRPVLAGVLLGLAAAVKPQTLVLLPVALIAARQWRALAAAAGAGLAAVLAATLIFGAGAWVHWLAAIPRFERLVATPGFERGMITPTALGLSLALGGGALAAWRLAFVAAGIAIAWTVFRTTDDPARRLTALLGGSLFITPYAMHYDAALLAPAAVIALSARSGPLAWTVALAGAAMLCCAAIPHWGAAAVSGFVLVLSLTPATASGGALALAKLSRRPEQEAAGQSTVGSGEIA